MRVAAINGVEEHSRHIGRVYQEYYARLRHYFLPQLGDAAKADACVHRTIRHFFLFMEDRCWEADVEHVPVYLMRIAGGVLCSEKLAAQAARRRRRLGRDKAVRLFDSVRREVLRPVKGGAQSALLFLRSSLGGRRQQVPSLRRAPAALV